MKLHCPHCGVKGSAEDSYSGRKVKCPKCQGVFTVEPDMALELAEDATSVSPATVEPSLSASEVDTINLSEEEAEQPVTEETVSVVAVDEQIEIAGDLSEPEAVTAPAAEEELDWEDVASEIDLQENEALAEEEDDTIELEEPVDGLDLSGEDDRSTEDEAIESRVIDAAEDPEPAITEEAVEIVETAETMESAESVEEKEEDVPEEVAQVEEEKEVEEQPEPTEDEPSGVVQEQCWQCGKTASVGESFVVTEDRLYCSVCLPAEELQETVIASQEQGSDTTSSADAGPGQASDKISLGEVIKKTWAKIRNAWSS